MIKIVSYHYIGPYGMLPSDFIREMSGDMDDEFDRSVYTDDVVDMLVTQYQYLRLWVPELHALFDYVRSDQDLLDRVEVRIDSSRQSFLLRCYPSERIRRARYLYYVESIESRYDISPDMIPSYASYQGHINYMMPDKVVAGGWVSYIQTHFQDFQTKRIAHSLYRIGSFGLVM
jgi:hypothetical protein